MDKVIKLLREQMILCSRLSELFGELSTALKESRSGADVTSSVQGIEPLMMNLSKNDLKIQEFLKSAKFENVKTFVEAQSNGVERNVAERLLTQTNNLQNKLRHQITNVAHLLMNSKAFMDFNINVMSQTVANTTYGPGRNIGQHQKRRVFDANA